MYNHNIGKSILISALCYIQLTTMTQSAELAQPKFQWGRQIGTAASDFGRSVAVDSEGNLFISGSTAGSLGGQNMGGDDIFLSKLTEEGDVLWRRQAGSPSEENIVKIAVDQTGNCYVAGSTNGSFGDTNQGGYDIYLVKFDSEGTLVWTRQIGSSGDDQARGLDIGTDGNIVITGSTNGNLATDNLGYNDVFMIEYNGDGSLISKKQFGTDRDDIGYGIAFDENDNIFVCGSMEFIAEDSAVLTMDGFITKFNNKREMLWQKKFGSNGFDIANSIRIDPQGDIVVGGSTSGSFGGEQVGGGDAYLAKFDRLGNKIWATQFGGNEWEGVLSVALSKDDSHDIIVGGCQTNKECEGYCRRYDEAGNLLWIQQFTANGAGSGGMCGKDVAIDAAGNCYHIGGTGASLFSQQAGEGDIYVVKIVDN